MSDTLEMKDAEVRALASTVDAQAAALPTGTSLSIDACGRASVAESAASFSLWAHVQNQLIAEKLGNQATAARDAVAAFDEIEKAIAANVPEE